MVFYMVSSPQTRLHTLMEGEASTTAKEQATAAQLDVKLERSWVATLVEAVLVGIIKTKMKLRVVVAVVMMFF